MASSSRSSTDYSVDSIANLKDEASGMLLLPLQNAPVVSLRSLEDGNSSYSDKNLSSTSLWARFLMTLRHRNGARSRSAEEHPLQLGENKLLLENQQVKRAPRRGWVCKALSLLIVAILCFFGITHLVNVALALVNPVSDDQDVALPAAWKLDSGAVDAAALANLTRDVTPIPCHSHNDYWRMVPLYDALRYGCTGVEADVWLFDNELFVGHDTNALSDDRTFRSMYVDRLVELLDQQNQQNRFTTRDPETKVVNGIFQTAPAQPVVLLVDFKNDGRAIYPVVLSQLAALREKNYLTYYDGTTLHQGPITVVATGNAPFDLISAESTRRDIFFDAPLDRMYEDPKAPLELPPAPTTTTLTRGHSNAALRIRDGQGTVGTSPDSNFTSENSYYASVSFASTVGTLWFGHISPAQLDLIRGQIRGAKRRGLKVRYWATPKWPISLRNRVWQVLIEEGADYLNGDDLKGLTRVDWAAKRHHWWLGG